MLDRSALLPTETNEDSPSPSSPARSIAAIASAPLCDRNATGPAGGRPGANDASSATAGSVVITPGSWGRRAASPSGGTAPAAGPGGARPSGPASANPSDEHDQRAHARARARGGGVEHGGGGHDDHRQLDRGADRLDRRVGAAAGDAWAGGVDEVDATAEAAVEQVGDHRRADGAGAIAGADHGDRRWGAGRGRPRRPRPGRRGRRSARSASGPSHVAIETCSSPSAVLDDGPQPALAEDLDHPPVLGQHDGREPLDADRRGGLGEVREHRGGDALAAQRVVDGEGDLGIARPVRAMKQPWPSTVVSSGATAIRP